MPHAVGQLLSRWLLVLGRRGGRTVSGWCGKEVRTYQSFLRKHYTEKGEERRRLKGRPLGIPAAHEHEGGGGIWVRGSSQAVCLYSASYQPWTLAT